MCGWGLRLRALGEVEVGEVREGARVRARSVRSVRCLSRAPVTCPHHALAARAGSGRGVRVTCVGSGHVRG
eukprot:7291360-Prymnesium_polylepis.1